jgi:hypothetical protein
LLHRAGQVAAALLCLASFSALPARAAPPSRHAIAASPAGAFECQPVTQTELRSTRGEGLDASAPSGAKAELAVVLWDEYKKHGTYNAMVSNQGQNSALNASVTGTSR